MSSLLERMSKLMEENDIKANHMTAELGISRSSFTDWKKGKGSPSLETVAKFSEFFHVSIDFLVYGTEPLEISNIEDRKLLEKFHSLPPEQQKRLAGYIDGMLDALQN